MWSCRRLVLSGSLPLSRITAGRRRAPNFFFAPRYGNNAIRSLDQARVCLTTKAWNQPLLAGDIPIPGYRRLLPYIAYLCISSWPQRQAPPQRLREGDPKRRHSLVQTSALELRMRAPLEVTTLAVRIDVQTGHLLCTLALCLTMPWQASPATPRDSGYPAPQGTAK